VNGVELVAALETLEQRGRLVSSNFVRPHFTYWGRTRIAYAGKDSEMSDGWMLREYLTYARAWQPLLHVSFQYREETNRQVLIALRSSAFAWSFASSSYDGVARSWKPKVDLEVPRASAKILANSLQEACSTCLGTDIDCALHIDGKPDLSGSIGRELTANFPGSKVPPSLQV
jgi:hypothetical protein